MVDYKGLEERYNTLLNESHNEKVNDNFFVRRLMKTNYYINDSKSGT